MLWLAAAIFSALLLVAPIARADDADDQFINALATQGITGDREQLIADGHAACEAYGTARMIVVMMEITGQGFDKTQAFDVIHAGLRAYCPEKAPPQ